jgi:hypothetical protein
MISAIYDLALTTGANRVIRGARIEHVVTRISGQRRTTPTACIVRTALRRCRRR